MHPVADIVQRLNDLRFSLDGAPEPGGSYRPVNIRGDRATIAIQFPIEGDRFCYQGRLGREISTSAGREAAALCVLNVLRQIHRHIGFDRLAGIDHLDICYQPDEDWDMAPLVADAASELLLEILGEERGRHTRSLAGVYLLPRRFCIGITATCSILAGS